jgi:hypothetical protein
MTKIVIDDIMIRQSDKDSDRIIITNRKQKRSLSFTKDNAFRVALTLLTFADPVPYKTVEGKNGEVRVVTAAELAKKEFKLKEGQTDVTNWLAD